MADIGYMAMVMALIAALTLLPQLIIFIKPLGPEGSVPDMQAST